MSQMKYFGLYENISDFNDNNGLVPLLPTSSLSYFSSSVMIEDALKVIKSTQAVHGSKVDVTYKTYMGSMLNKKHVSNKIKVRLKSNKLIINCYDCAEHPKTSKKHQLLFLLILNYIWNIS